MKYMNVFFKCVLILSLIACIFETEAHARDKKAVVIPPPLGVSYLDPKIEDMKWFHGTIGAVEVISVEDGLGLEIERYVPKNKELLSRWGLKEPVLTAPVRMMVVPTEELMKKLFRINRTKVEPFREYEGEVIHVVYLLAKDAEASVNEAFTQLFLAEQEKQEKSLFNWWSYRGMSFLNSSPQTALLYIKSLDPNSSFNVKDMMTITKEQWEGMSQQDQEKFDSQATMLCLLLRKHFGQKPLVKFWSLGSNEQALKTVYGFQDFGHLDKSYQRYLSDLVKDANQNKIPTEYLTIEEI